MLQLGGAAGGLGSSWNHDRLSELSAFNVHFVPLESVHERDTHLFLLREDTNVLLTAAPGRQAHSPRIHADDTAGA